MCIRDRQLPWCYAFLTLKPVKTPFTMYSSVIGDFVITQLDENKQLHRYDTKGNTYTQQQVHSLLPSLYVRQLTADERFPDTICGKAVSPKDIQLTNFTFKSVPSVSYTHLDVYKRQPIYSVWDLLSLRRHNALGIPTDGTCGIMACQ